MYLHIRTAYILSYLCVAGRAGAGTLMLYVRLAHLYACVCAHSLRAWVQQNTSQYGSVGRRSEVVWKKKVQCVKHFPAHAWRNAVTSYQLFSALASRTHAMPRARKFLV
ncbi:hypothetical protein F4825DRAFT_413126 [Nemania diffusa]|nr:hypothetical protein F4825DRAFT_413126 [Nemania diffusa]